MRLLTIALPLLLASSALFPSLANAQQVKQCSGANIPPGWVITWSEKDTNCGWQYGVMLTIVNADALPHGVQLYVCNIERLPAWWQPIEYISQIPGAPNPPCAYGGPYRYRIEKKG